MKMRLHGDKNQCPSCSEYFYSTSAFDSHRTGTFGKDRRCRTVAEMLEKGMNKDSRGFWRNKPPKNSPFARHVPANQATSSEVGGMVAQ